jgi:hypothetical protein
MADRIGRSVTARQEGLGLVLAAVSIIAILALGVMLSDAHFRSEVQAEAQSVANAVAIGSAAELPKGTVPVIRSAGRIFESQKVGSSCRRYGEQEIQIGHWDVDGQSFLTGKVKPNAVRITIRLRRELSLFAAFSDLAPRPIEASAIAVLEGSGHSLVAEACATSANAIR